jgi:hypothetical protein
MDGKDTIGKSNIGAAMASTLGGVRDANKSTLSAFSSVLGPIPVGPAPRTYNLAGAPFSEKFDRDIDVLKSDPAGAPAATSPR